MPCGHFYAVDCTRFLLPVLNMKFLSPLHRLLRQRWVPFFHGNSKTDSSWSWAGMHMRFFSLLKHNDCYSTFYGLIKISKKHIKTILDFQKPYLKFHLHISQNHVLTCPKLNYFHNNQPDDELEQHIAFLRGFSMSYIYFSTMIAELYYLAYRG